MTITELERKVGGLSKPSKMPGYGYSISAKRCKTGSKLVKVPNSVCHNCYALKGRYTFPNVQKALERRYNIMTTDPMWEFNMVELINKRKLKWFRWMDSGDLQDVTMLRKICFIAASCPNTKFWLPTREKHILNIYLIKYKKFPSNLCVRLSAHLVNVHRDVKEYPNSSTVITKSQFAYSTNICPATIKGNDNSCDAHNCRKCWDSSVKNINYIKH